MVCMHNYLVRDEWIGEWVAVCMWCVCVCMCMCMCRVTQWGEKAVAIKVMMYAWGHICGSVKVL